MGIEIIGANFEATDLKRTRKINEFSQFVERNCIAPANVYCTL
jgi:hypothetical protein